MANWCIDTGRLVEAVVAVLLGQWRRRRHFRWRRTYTPGRPSTVSAAVADVNVGDGKPYLAAGNDRAHLGRDGSGWVFCWATEMAPSRLAETYPTQAVSLLLAVCGCLTRMVSEILARVVVATNDLKKYTWGGANGVLLGNGDGTFRPAVTYSSGGIVPPG